MYVVSLKFNRPIGRQLYNTYEYMFDTMSAVKKFLAIVPEEYVPEEIVRFSSASNGKKIKTPAVKSHPSKADVFVVTMISPNRKFMSRTHYLLPDDDNVKENSYLLANRFDGSDMKHAYEIVSVERESDCIDPQPFAHSFNEKLNEHGCIVPSYDRKTVAIQHGWFKKEAEAVIRPFVKVKGACLFNKKNEYVSNFAKNNGDGTYDCYLDDGSFANKMSLAEAIDWLGGHSDILELLDI